RGKELKKLFDETENNLKSLPQSSEEDLKALVKEKDLLHRKLEDKARAEALLQELKKQQEKVLRDKTSFEKLISSEDTTIKKTQEEILPLETTLKLQEVLTASHICIEHG